MLQLDSISKTYRGRAAPVRVLQGFSLELKAGEFVAVQGASGSGKTTLLLMAGGMLRPDSGRVLVAGTDVYALAPDARARFRGAHIGFVFQQFHLVPYLNVLENVLCAALAHRTAEPRPRALALLEQFGLAHRLEHAAGELSTGERQRTGLARALLNRPELLLADEPTGNLDTENSAAVLGYLKEFSKAGGTVLLVTHQAKAAQAADRQCLCGTAGLPGSACTTL